MTVFTFVSPEATPCWMLLHACLTLSPMCFHASAIFFLRSPTDFAIFLPKSLKASATAFAPFLILSQFLTMITVTPTTPATIAPPRRNGAAADARLPRDATRPPPPAIFMTRPPIFPSKPPMFFVIPPIPLVRFPTMIRSGPAAATSIPILTIMSFWPSERLENHLVNSLTFATTS